MLEAKKQLENPTAVLSQNNDQLVDTKIWQDILLKGNIAMVVGDLSAKRWYDRAGHWLRPG